MQRLLSYRESQNCQVNSFHSECIDSCLASCQNRPKLCKRRRRHCCRRFCSRRNHYCRCPCCRGGFCRLCVCGDAGHDGSGHGAKPAPAPVPRISGYEIAHATSGGTLLGCCCRLNHVIFGVLLLWCHRSSGVSRQLPWYVLCVTFAQCRRCCAMPL